MRKLILALTVICLASCSEGSNDGIEENTSIDKSILGKWKVEYSKTINPAVYILDEDQLKTIQQYYPDYELGLNYPEDARIKEYFGNPLSELTSYLFNSKEDAIEIASDNIIKIYSFGTDGTMYDAGVKIQYEIKDGFLKWQTAAYNPVGVNKYQIDGDELIIELVKAEGAPLGFYTISRYSRISE